MAEWTGPGEAWLEVVRGDPTAEEIAALAAALRVMLSRRPAPPAPRPSAWVRSSRPDRTVATLPADRGPGMWRTAGRPG